MATTLLAKYLRESSLTHEAFADIAGVPAPLISLWTRGLRRPGLEFAFRIETATKGLVPASYWRTVETPKKVTEPRRKTGGRR